MSKARVVAALLVVLVSMGVLPAVADDTQRYTARVDVPDQSRSTRAAVLDEALAQVLKRVTGQPDVAGEAEVESVLAGASELVQRFSYERNDEGELVLAARFDGGAVRQALISTGRSVWQRDRPPVLAWIAVETASGKRTLVGSDQADGWRRSFADSAEQLGIALTFPLLDLADQRRVRFPDVAGGFRTPVREASRRYDSPLILMGSLRARAGQWRGRWQLLGPGDKRRDWELVAAERQAALRQWRHELAVRLRDSYAILPDPESGESVQLRFAGVNTVQDFGWLQDTLGDLSGVTGVRLRRVKPERVRFGLQVSVARSRVLRILDRNSALVRKGAADGRGAADTPVAGPVYRVQR